MVVTTTYDPLAPPESAMRSSSHGIGVTGLSAGYWRDEPVLDGFAMRLNGPGWFHLAAPNGAGKSTLFEVLAGYLDRFAGDVVVGDLPVRAGRRVPPLRLVRAEPALVPGVTVRDHLHLYARRYGRSLDALVDLAVRLGLEPHLDKAPHSLSTGSLKKAWFACNWAGTEPVWCIDEPFNGVDTDSVKVMADLVCERAAESLVLVAAHQLPGGVIGGPAPGQFIGEPFVLREVLRG